MVSPGLYAKSSELSKQEHEFEVDCILVEKEFQRLKDNGERNKKIVPEKYTCYLVMGVLLGVWSIYYQVYIWAAGCLEFKGIQTGTFLDHAIENVRES